MKLIQYDFFSLSNDKIFIALLFLVDSIFLFIFGQS